MYSEGIALSWWQIDFKIGVAIPFFHRDKICYLFSREGLADEEIQVIRREMNKGISSDFRLLFSQWILFGLSLTGVCVRFRWEKQLVPDISVDLFSDACAKISDFIFAEKKAFFQCYIEIFWVIFTKILMIDKILIHVAP